MPVVGSRLARSGTSSGGDSFPVTIGRVGIWTERCGVEDAEVAQQHTREVQNNLHRGEKLDGSQIFAIRVHEYHGRWGLHDRCESLRRASPCDRCPYNVTHERAEMYEDASRGPLQDAWAREVQRRHMSRMRATNTAHGGTGNLQRNFEQSLGPRQRRFADFSRFGYGVAEVPAAITEDFRSYLEESAVSRASVSRSAPTTASKSEAQYRRLLDREARGIDDECAICCQALAGEIRIKEMPSCRHLFHGSCIQRWLKRELSCPICRAPVLPVQRQRQPGMSTGTSTPSTRAAMPQAQRSSPPQAQRSSPPQPPSRTARPPRPMPRPPQTSRYLEFQGPQS